MKEKKNICTGCAAAEADGRFVRHPEGADGEAGAGAASTRQEYGRAEA